MDNVSKAARSRIMRANTGDRLGPETRLDAALRKFGFKDHPPTANYTGLYYVRNPKMSVTAAPAVRKRHGESGKGGRAVSYARPDFLFLWPGGGLVVLLHGCFWHCCPVHFKPVAKGQHEGWMKKFEGNKARDRRVLASFRRQGYHTKVVWEHSVKTKERAEMVAATLFDRIADIRWKKETT